MDEVFTKVSCVLRQKKNLDEKRHASNFGSSFDCTQSDDRGGTCVRKKILKCEFYMFITERRCQWKRGVVSKKRSKKVGQPEIDTTICF